MYIIIIIIFYIIYNIPKKVMILENLDVKAKVAIKILYIDYWVNMKVGSLYEGTGKLECEWLCTKAFLRYADM